MAPHDPAILMNLGRLHGLRYDYDLADKSFKAAIRLSSWRMESFLEAGAICIQLNRFEMAERHLKRAVERKMRPLTLWCFWRARANGNAGRTKPCYWWNARCVWMEITRWRCFPMPGSSGCWVGWRRRKSPSASFLQNPEWMTGPGAGLVRTWRRAGSPGKLRRSHARISPG